MMNTKNPYIIANSGWAGFIYGSIFFIKNVREITSNLRKRNLDFKLVLIATDWEPGVMLHFTKKSINVRGVESEIKNDSEQWDALMETDSKTFIDYFMHKIGTIVPLLPIIGKIKVKKLLKITRLLWYVQILQRTYPNNAPDGYAMYYKHYYLDHDKYNKQNI